MARKLAEKYKREILTMGLILVAVLVYMGMQSVSAALMAEEKDVISTSAPSTDANHEIWFKPGVNFAASNTLKITLDGLFTTAPTNHEDVDLSFGAAGTNTEIVLAAAAGSTNTWSCSISSTEVTFTVPSGATAPWLPTTTDLVIVEIGTNATADDGTGNEQYKNPDKVDVLGTADVYDIDIQNLTTADTGKAMVAIIEGVTVSATVAESLKFYIDLVTGPNCDTAFGNQGDASVDSSSVNFGSITPGGGFWHGCQNLSIGTNAANGYNITSQESDYLKSDSITIPDTPCDATCTEILGKGWATSTNYGFGHTCSTIDGSACDAAYGAGSSYRQFARTTTETPQDIMVNTSTPSVVTEKGLVEYKITISDFQAAGLYTNTITYIATPNF